MKMVEQLNLYESSIQNQTNIHPNNITDYANRTV